MCGCRVHGEECCCITQVSQRASTGEPGAHAHLHIRAVACAPFNRAVTSATRTTRAALPLLFLSLCPSHISRCGGLHWQCRRCLALFTHAHATPPPPAPSTRLWAHFLTSWWFIALCPPSPASPLPLHLLLSPGPQLIDRRVTSLSPFPPSARRTQRAHTHTRTSEHPRVAMVVLSVSPSASAPALPSQIPTRATAAPNAFITSVGLHPIEPIQVVGLSSGEVCFYTAKTDALSWFVEMDAARQAQLRLDTATDAAMRSNSGSRANGGGAGTPPVTLAPPEYPVKVMSFNTASAGCSIVHCGFLRGREEDLLREVVQRLQPYSSPSAARHLLYVITSANDVYVVDVKTEVVFLHWAGGGSTSGSSSSPSKAPASPLSPQFIVTQAETYGALMYLTVARRSAVKAATEQAASRGRHLFSGGGGPERSMYQRCNEPAVYVLHLGCTKPLAASTTKALIAGGGAYVIQAVSKGKPHPTSKHRGSNTASATASAGALSIRAHPLAPLLLLLLNQSEVQVYAVDGDGGEATPKKAQLIFLSAASVPRDRFRSCSSSSSAQAAASRQQQPVIDAQFVPSAAVLVPCHGAGHSSSSCKWICHNVQILLVTPTRLQLLCTRAVAATAGVSSADRGDVIAADRAFYTAPSMSAATSSSALPVPHVTFLRAWTWLGSPDTLFALQSDRVLVELSCNDLISASMDVPSVRSRRLLPPRTVTRLTGCGAGVDVGSAAGAENCWLTPSSPAKDRSGGSATAADGGGAAGLSCVQWPDVLPLWGRSAILSGVFAPPLPPNHGEDPHTLIFSRLTGLARPLPIGGSAAAGGKDADAEDDTSAGSDVLHLSLLADTETISSRCICVRLCLTPQPSLTSTSTAARPGLPLHHEQESVNVNVARLLCDSAMPALCRLEHGFYFVGSRAESAYADYPFLIAGLLYIDGVVEDAAGSECAGRAARLRAAMICLPADKHALRSLYELARRSPDGDGLGSLAGAAVAPTSELKHALLQAVRHTQVQPLPIPQFDFEVFQSSSATPSKQLLSCSFQLSNDGVVPCVWGLWAPLPEAASTSTAKSAATAPPPQQQPVQLTMQAYYIAADTQELRWRPPELVHMDDLLLANPSQVFALSSVLANAVTGVASASAAVALAPYKSVEDVLLDVDPVVVARLFLYYADRKVLVLATVETVSSSSSGGGNTEAGGVMDDTYNFASRPSSERVMKRTLLTGGHGGAVGEDRQYLCLVPHAAAEMNGWKADSTAESLGCSLLTSVQLSAVTVSDHDDPALQVAVVSRRFGVALATFPLPGRRGVARVSASLLPVKVRLCRRWDELLRVTAAVNIQAEQSEGSRCDATSSGGMVPSSAPASPLRGRGSTACSLPLLRRYRAWVDTLAHPASTYASVPLALWVWSPAWPGEDAVNYENATSAAAAPSPVLLLQRGCALYVLHVSGAAVQMCASLLHCAPLQVVPRASPISVGGTGELHLQHGNYLCLVARNQLLRQLQLQYARYSNPSTLQQAAATTCEAKWFKKLMRQAESSTAARLRLKERPQMMEWLRSVYAPAASELAYDSPSSSSGSAKSMQLTGAGATHVADVLDVDVTHLLRLATLAVEALAASQGIQQFVFDGTLGASLRHSLQHITAVLARGSSGGDKGHANGVAESRSLPGSWAVAEALARLPLACATRALSQEAAHAATNAAAPSTAARKEVPDSSWRCRAAAVRRWWWLVMRSSSLVLAVNEAQADEAQRELSRTLDVIPLNSVLLRPMAVAANAPPPPNLHGDDHGEAEAGTVVDAVAQALLLCPPQFMPHSVTQLLRQRDGGNVSAPPQQQQQRRLRAALVAALETLGANGGEAGADGTASLTALFSTVCIDSAHWTHAVYYTNLLGHLRHLALQESATEAPVREFASQCIKSADAAMEGSAAAVLEVATQTVAALLGAVVDVPAASRSRMATAVAQSMSKRQQALQRCLGPSRKAAGRGAGATGGSPMEEDVYFLEHSPVDQLRHHLYKAQWRDVYGNFAYPTRYFFRSAVRDSAAKPAKPAAVEAAPPHYRATDLPYQLLYNSRIAEAVQQTSAPRADQNAPGATTSVSVFSGRQGRVKKVLLTEQPVASSGAAAPPPAVELVPALFTPMSPLQHDTQLHDSSAQQQQSTTLSLCAAVAKEEAALHKTYFDAFAAADEGEAQAEAQRQQQHPLSSNSAGYDLRNDPLLQQFQARLSAGEAEEAVSASTTLRHKQQEEERQRVLGPLAFAPSATRRVAHGQGDAVGDGITTGGTGATGAATASPDLYGALPTQQEFFARFASDG
ncbi:hypothetical protein LdCL_150013800 [Leishmania donovani]|uniref:Uncharacterized protein n=2 Tax=Leishmania donovani TaxID=5661 RepID=A0A3Q8IDE7_LEIDO|nr:hypothetical protein LdCL_150013800 [Leishmania donovani]